MFSTDKFFKFSIPLQATSFLDPANPGPGTANGDQKEREEPELSDTHQEALPPPAAIPWWRGRASPERHWG